MSHSRILKRVLLASLYIVSGFLIINSLVWASFTLSGGTEKELNGLDPLSLIDVLSYLFRFILPRLSIEFFLGFVVLGSTILLHFKWKKRRGV